MVNRAFCATEWGKFLRVKTGKQEIGSADRTFIVAEIGINHNGELALAKKLISAAKQAGCDAVKFQKR
ncbi:MAG: hypothetical protein LBI62_08550, partial [Candidatus Accumulibacter sp.]|nr:hypothetical protein [Accumulibacter sp.]